MKRFAALLLALIMTLSLCPITVWAESVVEYEVTEGYTSEIDLGVSDEELFAAYVQKTLDESLGYETPSFWRTSALEEGTLEKEIYNKLKAELAKIASGEETSTEFTFSSFDHDMWTPEELGVDSFWVDSSLSSEVAPAIQAKLKLVAECLLADCPMELYWHDKSASEAIMHGFRLSGIPGRSLEMVDTHFTFKVASAYSASGGSGTYVTDAAKTGAAAAAVASAQSIVASNASKNNYDKLDAYRNVICGLVSYNHAAADSGSSVVGIDPWQLIYVFDQNPNTNVVCEGYAKAFQYLCDLSTFSGDVYCSTVTGTMTGGTGAGRHMWNVVTMEDGRNYLVDVTNCDADSIGYPDKLFMAYTTDVRDEGSVHVFEISGTNIYFGYDPTMADLFCDGYLALSPVPYGTVITPPDVSVSGEKTALPGEEVVLTLTANGSNLQGLSFTMAYSDNLEYVSHNSYIDGWNVQYNSASGRFVMTGVDAPINTDTDVLKVTFHVKDDAVLEEDMYVEFSDIVASAYENDQDVDDVTWGGMVHGDIEARWGLTTGTHNEQLPETWAGSGTLAQAMAYANGLESGAAYIQLMDDVDTSAPLVFYSGKTTILDLNGHVIDRGLTVAKSGGCVLGVDGNLSLCDTSDGANGKITGGGDGGVSVGDTGAFTLYSGAVAENIAYGGGGGVDVDGGSFTMNGGSITGNTAYGGGGGVILDSATFTMNGGSISGNTAKSSGGGVCMLRDSLFTMNGGSITNNTAEYEGGGVDVSGNTFIMTGGTISGNKVANTNFNTPSQEENTGDFIDASGGGVYVFYGGSFTMKGGSITGNTAERCGGGVYVSGGDIQLSGAAVISGNTLIEDGGTNNLHFWDSIIAVEGPLQDGANIGVLVWEGTLGSVIAEGAADYQLTLSDAAKFTSDDGYEIGLSENTLCLAKSIAGTVSVSGTGVYGETLTATYTGEEPVVYQWYRNGEAISGATAQSYTLCFEDIGGVIKVVAAGTDGYAGMVEAIFDGAVIKATPSVEAPDGLTAIYGETLKDVALPLVSGGVWSWEDATLDVGDEGENVFTLMFVPTDPGYETVEFTVTVTVKKVPNGLWCEEIPLQPYTGKAVTPAVAVYHRDKLLTEKVDYTVSYKNNKTVYAPVDTPEELAAFEAAVRTELAINPKAKTVMVGDQEVTIAKVPQIIITGKGNYGGKETIYFAISPVELNEEDFLIPALSAAYTGKNILPKPVVTWNETGKAIKWKTDYEVYLNYGTADELLIQSTEAKTAFMDAGTYNLTVVGKGNFSGTATLNYDISVYTLMSKVKIGGWASSLPWNADGAVQTNLVLSDSGKKVDGQAYTLVEGVDYTVSYRNNTAAGTATAVFTGLGEYIGQVTKTFKITGLAISKAVVTGLPKAMDYTGEAITLSDYVLTDKASGEELVEGTDYTVSYEKNTAKGTATILFTGINKYSGTLKKTFKINGYDILKNTDGLFVVEEDIVAPFMKGGAKPAPVVTFNGKVLTAGTDYTLAYKNNTAVADETAAKAPMITISGKGNFSGKVTVNFTIQPKPLAEVELLVDDKPFTEKATGLPTVSLMDADGKKLAAGKDYGKVVSYTYTSAVELNDGTMRNAGDTVDKKDSIPVGTVLRVTVEGMGGYTDEATTTYRIVPASLAKATVKVANQQYTGKPIIPAKDDITVTLNKVELDADNYEIVSCTNNVNKGSATLTIRGVGDEYGGIKTVKFKIDAKTLFWSDMQNLLMDLFS